MQGERDNTEQKEVFIMQDYVVRILNYTDDIIAGAIVKARNKKEAIEAYKREHPIESKYMSIYDRFAVYEYGTIFK